MKIYRVGGAVRDKLLDYPSDENDWVVVGSSPEEMVELGYQPVGQDFPVFINTKSGEEYALARTERKSGHGYQGFAFHTAPDVSLEDDLIRRDLTINAMAEDHDGSIIDPHGGQQDLANKVLRHVSDAFTEDPLRVLRVARFAARYHHLGFSIAAETLQLMTEISASGELQHLVAERVWKETDRALCERSPDIYIQVLRDCGALALLFPEVEKLFGVAQRADYHPEVDTGIHILMSLQQAARLSDSSPIRFSVLVHDLGKGITPDHVLPSHSGHEARGLPLVKDVCDRLKVPNEHRQLAMVVTEFHLLCHKAFELKPETILKLLKAIGALKSSSRLDDFLTCCEADARGRTGFEDRDYPSSAYLRQAREIVIKTDIADLVEAGISGAEIGQQLSLRQTAALAEFKAHFSE
ncbi:multifunctional CCA addition/repair protein [Porticoccaceae bacterium]|nr:multifunctional CCA addition/repair protein [Porticoccaceae bacterium]MDB4262618.1 multifunctional CCA addition/repair protein [Porticoccaceae bacterium]MDB9953082.1 multifunctional CCA addition/repair protein [Porticoccaceae bacterium]MDC0003980.1 multifunctional CCA addition/repair protein [Porticoccaceae bacterium]